MATRGWHQVHGKWTRSLGERGIRIRLFQNQCGGVFYREVWTRGRKARKALGTTDRKKAERMGKELLAAIRSGKAAPLAPIRLTLGGLWARYREQCPTYLALSTRAKGDVVARMRILLAHFGERCLVREPRKVRDVAVVQPSA